MTGPLAPPTLALCLRSLNESAICGPPLHARERSREVEVTRWGRSGVACAGLYPADAREPEAFPGSNGACDKFKGQDGAGSVTSLTNSAGSVVQTYTYDSFGNQTASSGSLTNFFRYTGREFDSETGLYYYRARYYDPHIGRFLGEDPLGFFTGIDFYAYVANRPIDFNDPSGMCRSKSECLWSATKKEGIPFVVDALGAIPVEGTALNAVQATVAIGGIFYSDAHGDWKAVVGGGAGLYLIFLSQYEEWSPLLGKVIPDIGNIISGGLALRDLGHGIEDFRDCLKGTVQ